MGQWLNPTECKAPGQSRKRKGEVVANIIEQLLKSQAKPRALVG